MNKKVVLIVVAIILSVVGFFYFTEPSEQTTEAAVSNHTLGAGTSGVVLREFGDFQCPACAAYAAVIDEIKEKYGDQITFQFSHFPLEAIHQNARAASRAAEAAGMQGKFWEMHDKLFQTYQQWGQTGDPLSTFENFAREIGVADINKFTEDYKSAQVNAVINADLDAGRDIGAESTPTFVLNDKLIEENPGATVEAFSALIDAAIAEKSSNDSQSE